MRRGTRILAAVAAILAIAGFAPAGAPCCGSIPAGPSTTQLAPPPCCGTGCAAIAPGAPRNAEVSIQASVVPPVAAELHTADWGDPPAAGGRLLPVWNDVPGIASSPPLFLLHSQFLI